ncbi:MAG: nitroreductase family protein [Thermoleophilia bacterium]|nr:nitroreductase family protein [Thermoleophilia bacterium]
MDESPPLSPPSPTSPTERPPIAYDLLLSRRSIRRYEDRLVPDELVTRLLEAAMAAPSASNEQPWHFVVISRRELLDELSERHPYAGMLREAPLCIVPCGDLDLVPEGVSGEYWVQDVAAATQNLLLAATALGLGTVWCGVHPRPERVDMVREVLGIPSRIVPLCLVPVGYPAEQKPPRTQFDPARVHRDGW